VIGKGNGRIYGDRGAGENEEGGTMLKNKREEGQNGRKRYRENIEKDVYRERQAKRKRCTRNDRQRGRDVPRKTGREEEMYQERQAERKMNQE
jgi:hypothetical protein